MIFNAPSKAYADEVSWSIYQYAKELEEQYSFFSETSEIYLLNKRRKNHLIVSDELAGLLAISAFYYERTSASFDIAYAGTMYNCFQSASVQEYQEKQKTLLPYATFEHIHLHGNSVKFSNAYTQLDLGGLVKEYAVDQSILLLKQFNITSALVDFGGDVAAFGNYDGAKWNIGIQDPNQNESNLMHIHLDKAALCTSGHSKSFYMIGNTKISHIISNQKTFHKQISVLAPTALDAGVWSTSLLVNKSLTLPPHVNVISCV